MIDEAARGLKGGWWAARRKPPAVGSVGTGRTLVRAPSQRIFKVRAPSWTWIMMHWANREEFTHPLIFASARTLRPVTFTLYTLA
jgi:hypothetical protein